MSSLMSVLLSNFEVSVSEVNLTENIICEDPYCELCTDDSIDCIICEEGYNLSSEGYCYEKCHESCETCDGPHIDSCITCPDGVSLSDSYLVGELELGFCEVCHESCETCSGSNNTDCIDCAEGYKKSYDENYCYKECDESCETCNGPLEQNCLTCREDSNLIRMRNQDLQFCVTSDELENLIIGIDTELNNNQCSDKINNCFTEEQCIQDVFEFHQKNIISANLLNNHTPEYVEQNYGTTTSEFWNCFGEYFDMV